MVVVQASLIYIYIWWLYRLLFVFPLLFSTCTALVPTSTVHPILLHRSVDIMGERGTRPPFQGDVQVMMGDTEMETGQTIRELMGERDTTGEHRGEVHTSLLWRRNAKCFLVVKLTNNYTN